MQPQKGDDTQDGRSERAFAASLAVGVRSILSYPLSTGRCLLLSYGILGVGIHGGLCYTALRHFGIIETRMNEGIQAYNQSSKSQRRSQLLSCWLGNPRQLVGAELKKYGMVRQYGFGR